MDEIVKEFLVESYENLDRLDQDLVILEKDPRSKQTLASVFRTIHTIKGTAGFLSFEKLEAVAHVGENLLSKLRDGALLFNPEITSVLLASVDAIRSMLREIEKTGQTGDTDHSALIERLTLVSAKSILAPLPQAPPLSPTSPLAPVTEPAHPSALAPSAPGPDARINATAKTDGGAAISPNSTVPLGPILPSSISTAPAVSGSPAEEAHPPSDPSTKADSAAQAGTRERRDDAVSDSTIRVDVGILDKLMNLVGELVLSRNQILQFARHSTDVAFLATSQRLNLITTELQGSVMKTRMQPIGIVWGKLPRIVRDLATACGKEVRIEMEGKDTELDKTIIEAIKDPLTHIVRNSVDHGIESPEVRKAQGKPTEGCLKMRAYHESGQVIIEISDDGGGINSERVKQKAIQRGMITSDQAARLTEREVLHLIFLPGFSTAEKVTNVSGRGVGMDVVKTNIEKIGGTVDLQSRFGLGTTLRIKVPLTLAIIPALIVTSGGDRFAIPQVNLLELVRLEAAQSRSQIEFIYGAPVYRLRGQLLPLVYLNRELRTESAGEAARAGQVVNIVGVQAYGHTFGLVVDEINDTEEIVVKPLGKQLKGVTLFAGATIMGDGRVALILDVLGLAQKTGVVTEVGEPSPAVSAAPAHKKPDVRGNGNLKTPPVSIANRPPQSIKPK